MHIVYIEYYYSILPGLAYTVTSVLGLFVIVGIAVDVM